MFDRWLQGEKQRSRPAFGIHVRVGTEMLLLEGNEPKSGRPETIDLPAVLLPDGLARHLDADMVDHQVGIISSYWANAAVVGVREGREVPQRMLKEAVKYGVSLIVEAPELAIRIYNDIAASGRKVGLVIL